MSAGGGPTSDDDARIDEALEESFPASDPPFWTLGIEPRPHANQPRQDEDEPRPIRPSSPTGLRG